MTSADDVWHQPPAFVLFNRASNAAAVATVSARRVFLTLFFGYSAHLLGKDWIYGLNIQVHFCSHGSGD
jgi:hypothetical protein